MPYPDEFDALPTNNNNDQPNFDTTPALHNNANGAINRMQAELGLNPAGAAPSVAVRLAARPLTIAEKGGVLDGETDTANAINETILESVANGGGKVETGFGTGILEAPIEMRSGVHLVGEGEQATVLKGKDGTSHDLVKTLGFDALVGTDDEGGQHFWSVKSLTLDGNAADRGAGAGGRGFAVYGKAYALEHLIVKDTPGEGIFSEWYHGGDQMEAQVNDFKVIDSRSHGIHWRGPHDSVFTGGQVMRAGQGGGTAHGVWVDSNLCGGCTFQGVHTWGEEQTRAWFIGAGASTIQMVGCQGEGAQEAQLFLDGSECSIVGGSFFGIRETDESTGIIIGDPTSGEYVNRNLIVTNVRHCLHGIEFRHGGVRQVIILQVTPADAPGASVVVGTPDPTGSLSITTDAPGYENENLHLGMGRIEHYLGEHDQAAVLYRSDTGDQLVRVETDETTARWSMAAVDLAGYAAGAGSSTWELQSNGGLLLSERATAPAAPPGDRVVLFAQDNGAGKTRLMARFNTGAAVQVAIQP